MCQKMAKPLEFTYNALFLPTGLFSFILLFIIFLTPSVLPGLSLFAEVVSQYTFCGSIHLISEGKKT